jgi:hypothetical protein
MAPEYQYQANWKVKLSMILIWQLNFILYTQYICRQVKLSGNKQSKIPGWENVFRKWEKVFCPDSTYFIIYSV